jgi:hypothetical protein
MVWEILFASKSYKPFLYYLYGMLIEHKSKREKKKVYDGTWAYYGFEAVIWARKRTP